MNGSPHELDRVGPFRQPCCLEHTDRQHSNGCLTLYPNGSVVELCEASGLLGQFIWGCLIVHKVCTFQIIFIINSPYIHKFADL